MERVHLVEKLRKTLHLCLPSRYHFVHLQTGENKNVKNVNSRDFKLQLLPLDRRITRFHVLSRVSDWENEAFSSSGDYIPIVYDEASSSQVDEFQIRMPRRNKNFANRMRSSEVGSFPDYANSVHGIHH